MSKIRIVAKSYDDAINDAILKLGITSDNMLIEVEQEGSSGFMGLFSKPWILNISKKKEEIKDCSKKKDNQNLQSDKNIDLKREKNLEIKENIVSDSIKQEKNIEVKSENKLDNNLNLDELKNKIIVFLDNILKNLNINAEYEFNIEEDNTLNIFINSKDEMGILIGKRGQTLDSLQYLLSLYLNKDLSNYLRIKLDTEDYRNKRQEKLTSLAKSIANRVKNIRKPVKLEPMNPYERRIIHNALQQDRSVITKSEGEEPFRYIVILPKRNNYKKRKNTNDLNDK